MFEPAAGLPIGYGVAAARGVLTLPASPDATMPIRIINPGRANLTLYAGVCLGTVESLYEPADFSSAVAAVGPTDPVESEDDTPFVPSAPPPMLTAAEIDAQVRVHCSTLSDTERSQLSEFLFHNRQVFAPDPKSPGVSTAATHRIDTSNAAPVHLRPHRLGHHLLELQRLEVDKMLEAGIVPFDVRVVISGAFG